jgi:hypothetical protein
LADRPEAADRPVQPHELLVGQGFGALEQGSRAVVDVAHRPLLVIGQGEDAEGEDLVDLGGVEQVAGALGGDLRIVVEDDRRREHRVARPRLADQDRPGPDVAAAGSELATVLGRVDHREELAVTDDQDRVHRDERAQEGLVAIAAGGLRDRRLVRHPDRHLRERVGDAIGRDLHRTADRMLDADDRPRVGRPARGRRPLLAMPEAHE